jgi:hypothetical protein
VNYKHEARASGSRRELDVFLARSVSEGSDAVSNSCTDHTPSTGVWSTMGASKVTGAGTFVFAVALKISPMMSWSP